MGLGQIMEISSDQEELNNSDSEQKSKVNNNHSSSHSDSYDSTSNSIEQVENEGSRCLLRPTSFVGAGQPFSAASKERTPMAAATRVAMSSEANFSTVAARVLVTVALGILRVPENTRVAALPLDRT